MIVNARMYSVTPAAAEGWKRLLPEAVRRAGLTAEIVDYVAHGTATRECQQMGYANAIAFGQPVSTCSVYAGSLCMNTRITLSYQCQGVAIQPISVGGY